MPNSTNNTPDILNNNALDFQEISMKIFEQCFPKLIHYVFAKITYASQTGNFLIWLNENELKPDSKMKMLFSIDSLIQYLTAKGFNVTDDANTQNLIINWTKPYNN